MTTPAVVEKTLQDIEFTGLNEGEAPQSMDWTKYLKVADNCDFSTPGKIAPRKGLISPVGLHLAKSTGALTPIGRVLSTGDGIITVSVKENENYASTENSARVTQLDESGGTSDGYFVSKNQLGEYAVYPQTIGGISASSPVMIGSCYTTKYNVCCVKTAESYFLLLVTDKLSGNVVLSHLVFHQFATAGCITAVGEYVHLYTGLTGEAKLWQFNLTSQSTISTTPVVALGIPGAMAADVPVACVPNGSTSVLLMANFDIVRCDTTPMQTASGTIAGLTRVDDLATHYNGDHFYIVGVNATPRLVCEEVDETFASVATYTSADATLANAIFSVGGSNGGFFTLANYTFTSGVGGQTFPVTRSMQGVVVDVAVFPGWGNFTSPFFCNIMQRNYCMMVDLPQAGGGVGHNTGNALGCNVLVRLDGETNWTDPPVGHHIAAVTDNYVDYSNNSATTGYVKPQKLFSSDSGRTVSAAALQKVGPDSFAVEFRTFKLHDVKVIGCSTDIISGGRTSMYDGMTASECGALFTPAIVATRQVAGVGMAAGTYNYVIVWEAIDAKGRRHFSKTSNPYAITLPATDTNTLEFTFPNISDHKSYYTKYGSSSFHFKYHVYRTTNGGTQYYRVASAPLSVAAVTTAVLQISDSTTDATLQTRELLHRQPGTTGTALDRYYALASTCCVRHKDRVFYARGSTVYYSSFDVFGEANWFNPALSFVVPGGVGDIVALGSLEGLLVVFKKNAIFVVDGDGPGENGGNGTEFSPPRKLMCEVGCIDQRTLVSTNEGLMFRSAYSIELLARNLTVETVGRFVQNTLDSNPYSGGSTFDPSTSRAIWMVASATGTYPGQVDTTASGYALVYDTAGKRWSRLSLRNASGAGKAFQDVVSGEVGLLPSSLPNQPRVVWADGDRLYFESGYKDNIAGTEYFIPVTAETGWIRTDSKAERIRLTDFIISAAKTAAAKVTVSYAKDYNNSYTQIKEFTGAAIAAQGAVVQLNIQPPVEAVQSMSFKIVTADPTPTTMGTGQQMDIFGLTVRAGVRGGGAKLASAQKG